MTPKPTIEIPLSRNAPLVGGLVALSCAFWLYKSDDPDKATGTVLIAAVGFLALVGLTFVAFWLYIVIKKPKLILESGGLRLTDGTLIPWDLLTSARLQRIGKNVYGVLHAKDIEPVLSILPEKRHAGARINMKKFGGPLAFNLSMYTISNEDFISLLNERIQASSDS